MEFKCNAEQERARELVVQGKHVLITGGAGTGKSVMVGWICSILRQHKRRYYISAMTGLAGTHVNGTTLHKFLGVRIDWPRPKLLESLKHVRPRVKYTWCNTDSLIVDEISMLSPEMFEKMDMVAQTVRGSKEFMGGIQLILFGDFGQCPPVYKAEERRATPEKCVFLFESPLFSKTFPWETEPVNTVLLQEQYRQVDPSFQGMLNRIRLGNQTDADIEQLYSRVKQIPADSLIRPTRLKAKRLDVDKENMEELRRLEPNEDNWHVYIAQEKIWVKGRAKERALQLLKYHMEDSQNPPRLPLAIGAQVLLTRNLDTQRNLCNGSLGVVVAFQPNPEDRSSTNKKLFPLVKFQKMEEPQLVLPFESHVEENKQKVASYIQLPLRLAWALTIYKAQGMTLDSVLFTLDGSVHAAEAYVALSRVRNLEDLYLDHCDPKKITCKRMVRKYYMTLAQHFAPAQKEKRKRSPSPEA
jgi:ATP-dependent DNA helicase PIF1